MTGGEKPVTLSPMQSEPIQVTVTLSREDAACLWADSWSQKNVTIEDLVTRHATDAAAKYKSSFPKDIEGAKERFNLIHPEQ